VVVAREADMVMFIVGISVDTELVELLPVAMLLVVEGVMADPMLVTVVTIEVLVERVVSVS
jgi:hypothetical protein